MELYNSLIKDTKAFFDGKNPQRWSYNERDCWTDLGSSELVLQKDAAYELGAMGKGSANYVLFTSNAELVEHDEVELYGPDLKDIKGDCDFARIVLLRVGMLDEDDEIVYRTLKDIEFAKYHVYPEGYMLAAKVIFVTEKGMDYAAMQKEAKKANDVTGTLTHILEGLPTDCSVCALKDVCEEVEGMKELHFGIGSKGTDHH